MSNLRFCMPKAFAIGLVSLGVSLNGCAGGGSSLQTSSPLTQPVPAIALGGTSASARTSVPAGSVRRAASAIGYPAVVLGDGALSYYPLIDSISTLVDSGPYGINGTYGSGVTLGATPITAGVSRAAGFPGGTSYNPNGFASAPPNPALQPSTVTVEAWIQCNAQNSTAKELPIVVYGNVLSGIRYGLFLHGLAKTNYNTLLYMQNSNGQPMLRLYGTTRLSVGVTYHVVAVSNGSQVTTYINAVVDQTASYPGVTYSTPVTNGVQIGGAISNATYGSPPFAGTIAQAAVYGSALTSAQVANHYLAGQLIPMVTETSTRADSFVDSIGTNAHFGATGSLDDKYFPQASTLLTGLGVRHIRVGMNFNSPSLVSEMQQLAASGIHGDYIVSPGSSQTQVLSFPARVAPSLETFEPPNEPDDQVGQPYPTWVAPCIAFQQNLYSWVKGNPATARYPVLGPGLAWPASIAQLGNVSANFDLSNLHDYLVNYNPGNSYGTTILGMASATAGGKPIVVTEAGYGTGTTTPLVDDRTDLRYLTRMFFEYFNEGITRTYSYDFIEIGGASLFGQYGLVQSNLAPKPVYYGLKSIIGALNDPGTAFAPAALTYRLSGFTSSVHHLLMQKRNGSFVMAIWIEAPGWDTYSPTGGDIIVPPQTVTLSTAANFSSVSQQSMNEAGAFSTSPLSWSGNQVTFNVNDTVSLITLTP
jgi:hypothetical protein